MIKEIQNIFRLFFILFSGAAITVACESEPDELGMQFFQNGTAQGTEESFDVVAYNVYNNDALEADNDRFFAQLIHKEINKDCHRAEASMRCNKKGWGSDYFQYITIEPLYTDAW